MLVLVFFNVLPKQPWLANKTAAGAIESTEMDVLTDGLLIRSASF